MTLRTKRAYEPAAASDGARYLIDRLWPRGVRSKDLRLTAWRKELAPSDELRRFFQHDPDRFSEFRDRYLQELEPHAEELVRLREEARTGTVTLVYAARDGLRCNAGVLAELLTSSDPTRFPPAPKDGGSRGRRSLPGGD